MYFSFKMSWDRVPESAFSRGYSWTWTGTHCFAETPRSCLWICHWGQCYCQQYCSMRQSQKTKTKKLWTYKRNTNLKVWMSINKPEAYFQQISQPADQEGVSLLHFCYYKIVLYSLWKHGNPRKIHATPIFIKIPVVSTQETFLVWPRLIWYFYSLYIYHSRQVWNSYPMQ